MIRDVVAFTNNVTINKVVIHEPQVGLFNGLRRFVLNSAKTHS